MVQVTNRTRTEYRVRIGSATPPAGEVRFKSHFKLSTNRTIAVIKLVKIMIKNTNVDLSAMNAWGTKAWDGCLQATAINYYSLYTFLTIIIIIIIIKR